MTVEGWIAFWKWAYLIGLVSFFVVAIAVIPLGGRDLIALFRHLQRNKQRPDE